MSPSPGSGCDATEYGDESEPAVLRAELNKLLAPEVPEFDLRCWAPDRGPGAVSVHMLVGASGEGGGEPFAIVLCTPDWIAERAHRDGIFDASHYFVVASFDFDEVEAYLTRKVSACEGGTWQEIADQLRTFSHREAGSPASARPESAVGAESPRLPERALRAEVNHLLTPDVPELDLRCWAPDRGPGAVAVQMLIGTHGEGGGESFSIMLCTADWIVERAHRDGIFDASHYFVVANFSFDEVEVYLTRKVSACEGATWQEVADQLRRFSDWEFENYREFTPAPTRQKHSAFRWPRRGRRQSREGPPR